MAKKGLLVVRIHDMVCHIKSDAIAFKWREDVNKFDLEQAIKDRTLDIEKANKIIKDRRGIKD